VELCQLFELPRSGAVPNVVAVLVDDLGAQRSAAEQPDRRFAEFGR
jgi:hypothetical protein